MPSSVQGAPFGCLASVGQFGPAPVQLSAGSHSPFDERQVVLVGSKASAGQTVLIDTGNPGPRDGDRIVRRGGDYAHRHSGKDVMALEMLGYVSSACRMIAVVVVRARRIVACRVRVIHGGYAIYRMVIAYLHAHQWTDGRRDALKRHDQQ